MWRLAVQTVGFFDASEVFLPLLSGHGESVHLGTAGELSKSDVLPVRHEACGGLVGGLDRMRRCENPPNRQVS